MVKLKTAVSYYLHAFGIRHLVVFHFCCWRCCCFLFHVCETKTTKFQSKYRRQLSSVAIPILRHCKLNNLSICDGIKTAFFNVSFERLTKFYFSLAPFFLAAIEFVSQLSICFGSINFCTECHNSMMMPSKYLRIFRLDLGNWFLFLFFLVTEEKKSMFKRRTLYHRNFEQHTKVNGFGFNFSLLFFLFL